MNKRISLFAIAAITVGGIALVGCESGGTGGYHSTSSEQNVGSRSSHGVYGGTQDQTGTAGGSPDANAPATPYSQRQPVAPDVRNNNSDASNSINNTGTSQQNSGSGAPSGIAGQTAPNNGAAGYSGTSSQTGGTQSHQVNSNGNTGEQPGNLPANANNGTNAGNNNGTTATPAPNNNGQMGTSNGNAQTGAR